MKNIRIVNQMQECDGCGLEGFFCYTPNGADYFTCPCCGESDFIGTEEEENSVNTCKIERKFNDNDDMRFKYSYCNHCGIIFSLGCTHSDRGCTDNIFNCHFIAKWKNKITNVEYDGMPKFDDDIDWYDNVNNVEILQMHCPHDGKICKKTKYPISNCKLMK